MYFYLRTTHVRNAGNRIGMMVVNVLNFELLESERMFGVVRFKTLFFDLTKRRNQYS